MEPAKPVRNWPTSLASTTPSLFTLHSLFNACESPLVVHLTSKASSKSTVSSFESYFKPPSTTNEPITNTMGLLWTKQWGGKHGG
jgi:hypothetical protein